MASIAEIRQKYPQYNDMSDEALADALHKRFYSDMPRDQFNTKIGLNVEQPGMWDRIKAGAGQSVKNIDAMGRNLADALTLGQSDEIIAGLKTGTFNIGPFRASIGGQDAFAGEMANLEQQRAASNEAAPSAALGGQIIGGIASGAGLVKKGLSATARMTGKPLLARIPVAATEGAILGGAHGFGTGRDMEERKERAKSGAVFGALAGGTFEAASPLVAGAIRKVRGSKAQPSAPTSYDLADEAHAIYDRAHGMGVQIKPGSVNRLANNMKLAAGRLNPALRPRTAGVVDDVMAKLDQPMDLQDFDDLRQVVAQAMKGASPDDVRTLTIMQDMMDNFAEKVTPRDLTRGDVDAFNVLTEARGVWTRKGKARLIENMIEIADINTGQYSQSGISNTISGKFRELARDMVKNPQKYKSFTPEEIKLVKQIGKGQYSPAAIRWLSKFAPRSVVSAMLGVLPSLSAAAATGPVGAAVGLGLPMAGHLAGRSVDNAAMAAADAFRNSVASGVTRPLRAPTSPELLAIQRNMLPAISGANATANSR